MLHMASHQTRTQKCLPLATNFPFSPVPVATGPELVVGDAGVDGVDTGTDVVGGGALVVGRHLTSERGSVLYSGFIHYDMRTESSSRLELCRYCRHHLDKSQ